MFRYPTLPKSLLDRLYSQGSEEAWPTPSAQRVDWAIARAELAKWRDGGSILDIGCYDGRFLLTLGGSWKCYGIELNPAAAVRADSAGISMAGSDFASLDHVAGRFDAVTAFDVIEHVDNPAKLLSACITALRPGGLLIIATGDARSFPWRLLRARNAYCICPEHLAFVSPRWCMKIASSLGIEVVLVTPYRRVVRPLSARISDTAKSLFYRISPSAIGFLRRHGVGRLSHPVKADYPPLWPTAKDHFLVVFRKGLA
jgi:SAM-dependent methyltransferase